MALQQNPKKPKQSKRHKLTISSKDKWKQILREVEKIEAPVSVIQTITVHLVDGTQVDINVQDLLDEGRSADDLEQEINEKLEDYKLVDDMSTVPLDTHLRYFIKKNY